MKEKEKKCSNLYLSYCLDCSAKKYLLVIKYLTQKYYGLNKFLKTRDAISYLKLTFSWSYSFLSNYYPSKINYWNIFSSSSCQKKSLVFGHFWPIFQQKIDPWPPRSNFLPKRIHQNKFQIKISILSKNDGGATYVHTCYQNLSKRAC